MSGKCVVRENKTGMIFPSVPPSWSCCSCPFPSCEKDSLSSASSQFKDPVVIVLSCEYFISHVL